MRNVAKTFWGSLAAFVLLSAGSAAQGPGKAVETADSASDESIQQQTQTSQGTTLYFPDYVDGGGWSVQLAISNVARSAAAAVAVSAYDQDGQPLPELFDSETTFEIPPLGSRVLRSVGTEEIRRGWIEVRTDPPSVSGLLTYRNSETGVEVGVAPVELGDRFALFVEETSEVGAGLAVYKPDPDSRIELRIRNESGMDPLGEALIRGDFHQSALTLSEWFDVDGMDGGFLRDFRGLLLLRTEDESGFAPLGLRFGKETGALSAVPLIRDRTREAGERMLIFPDYVEGDGWSVRLALSNVDPNAAVQVVVTAHDPDGRPVPDLFNSEAEFEIPSLGSRVLRSTGAGEIRRGWIEVRTGTPGVSGSLIYGHSGTGVEVGVAPVEQGNHFALFVEETGEVGAGLAVLKPNSDSRIELRLRDESGRDPLDDVFIPWRDFRQSARTISEWFDVDGIDGGFLRDFRGLVFLRTADGSPFAPLGLRFGKGTGALSAVPVIRIVDGARIDGGMEIEGGVGIDGGGQAPPPTVTLAVSPSSIDREQSATLRWSSTRAESAEITPDIGEVPTSGTRKVLPRTTTTYRITVRGTDGQTATESVTVTVAVSERQALEALYEATDGPNWVNNENWLTDAPLGEWFGVTTNQEGRVVGLAMSYFDRDAQQWISNNVSGPIPPELGYLTRLEYLQFFANKLTGPILPELGKLANLTTLDFNANNLSGGIPPELGGLAKLTDLSLDSNDLSGPIPPELGGLSNLTLLWLAGNELTGPIPQSFLQLDSLRSFSIQDNDDLCVPGTSAFVAWLGRIEKANGPYCNESDMGVLERLYETAGGLDWTNAGGWLETSALEEWYGVTANSLGRVVVLDLDGNGLTGELVADLGSLRDLIALRIGNNALSGRLPLSLVDLPSLDELHYAGTGLCAPTLLRSWLDGIPSHEGSGKECAPTPVADSLSVRTVYAIPSNRELVQVYRGAVVRAVRHVQIWYGEELDGITFALADTVAEVCHLSEDDQFLIEHEGTVAERWAAALESVAHCGPRHDDEKFVWIVYFDVDEPCWTTDRPQTLGRGGEGLTLLGRWDLLGLTDRDSEQSCGHGGQPYGRWVGGLGHELGHAFGLPHPPGCDEGMSSCGHDEGMSSCDHDDGMSSCDHEALMWRGYATWPDTYLRDDEKEVLRGSPFFAERRRD